MSEAEEIAAAVAALEKPPMWSPCNGCGKCCTLELCHLAVARFGAAAPLPCPAMEFDAGRFWCGLIRSPGVHLALFKDLPQAELVEDVKTALGVGEGCGCP